MSNKYLLYIGGTALLAAAYFLTKKTSASLQYIYEISTDGQTTKATNTKTGNVDFIGDPKFVIEGATAIGNTLIKDGIYSTKNINLPSGTYLSGEGTNTILQCPDNTQENIVSTFNQNNITVRNLAIDGNRLNNVRGNNTAKQNGLYFSGCVNITLENCYVYRTIESGIQVTGRDGTPSSNIKLLDNIVDDTWAEGIVIFDNVSDVTVYRNTSSNNGELANGGYSGITIMRNISNTDIQYNTTFQNTIDGIAIDGDPGFENKNITVKNNISYSNRMAGIAFHDTINSNLSNNECYNNQLDGMFIGESNSNDVTNNNCHHNGQFGIELLNSNYILVDRNTVNDNARINIDLNTSSNNTITNNDSYNSKEDGLALDFSSTDNLIQYNKCYNNLHFGIATDTVHQPHLGNNTIDNNHVYSNRWDGIISIRGDYNIISNNKSHDNALSGILIEGRIQSPGTDTTGRSNYNDIINNECWNNDYGIRELPLPNYVCQYNKFVGNNNHDNRIVNELLEGTNHRS